LPSDPYVNEGRCGDASVAEDCDTGSAVLSGEMALVSDGVSEACC
jgi:hypothetical protein